MHKTKLHQDQGFIYLGLLVAITVLGIGLAIAAPIWQRIADRQRLQELDWIGSEFVRAIASYYEGTPGVVVKTYPPSLQSLVQDDRFTVVRRHLRRIYNNPFSGVADWEILLATQGGIRGIRVSININEKTEQRVYVFTPPPMGR